MRNRQLLITFPLIIIFCTSCVADEKDLIIGKIDHLTIQYNDPQKSKEETEYNGIFSLSKDTLLQIYITPDKQLNLVKYPITKPFSGLDIETIKDEYQFRVRKYIGHTNFDVRLLLNSNKFSLSIVDDYKECIYTGKYKRKYLINQYTQTIPYRLNFKKPSHQYLFTIHNPKFHMLQIPQPPVLEIEITVNGKSSIRKFPVKKSLVTSGSYVYVDLQESNMKDQSGEFNNDAEISIRCLKGYAGFTLWIDGEKVKETRASSLDYYYKESR